MFAERERDSKEQDIERAKKQADFERTYDDEADDGRYFRGAEWKRILRDFEREEAWDEADRKAERELNPAAADPIAAVASDVVEGKGLPPSNPSRTSPVAGAPAASRGQAAGAPAAAPAAAPVATVRTVPVSVALSVAAAPGASAPASAAASASASPALAARGKSAGGQSAQPLRRPSVPSNIFNAEDEDEDADGSAQRKRRKLVRLAYNEKDMIAAGLDPMGTVGAGTWIRPPAAAHLLHSVRLLHCFSALAIFTREHSCVAAPAAHGAGATSIPFSGFPLALHLQQQSGVAGK